MAGRGITIPVRIQNELAAGLDVAQADLKKFVDGAVASNARVADSYRMAAKAAGESAAFMKKGSDEQLAALKLQADYTKKAAIATGEYDVANRKLGGGFSSVGKGAEEAKGKLGGLLGSAKSLAFSFAGLGAAFGGYELLKGSIDNAEMLSKANASLSVSINKLGGNFKAARPEITAWAKEQQQYGVSIVTAEQGFARLIPMVGGAQRAMKAYNLALILSKAEGIDLNAAERSVAKAIDGKTSSLQRYGIVLQKNATAEQVEAAIQKRFGGQAAANTSAMDKLRASVANIETELGQKLLPIISKYLDELSNWLDKSKNQKMIIDAVKQALHDMGVVINIVREGFKILDKVTGSFSNTLKTMGIVGAAAFVAIKASFISTGVGAVIVGLATAAMIVIDHWKTVQSWFESFWRWMEKKASSFLNVLIGIINKMISAFNAIPFVHNIGHLGNVNFGGGHHFTAAQQRQVQHPKGSGSASSVVAEAKAYGVGSGGTYQTGGGHGGVVKPGSKLDCSGYVWQVFTAAGFKDFPGTSEEQWNVMSGPNWASEHISVSATKPGDVVFMVGVGYKPPGHVGIVVSGSGSNAKIMQYYESGKPPAVFGFTLDTMGVKRFYLIKSGSKGGGKHGTSGGGSHHHHVSNPFGKQLPLPATTTTSAAHHHHHLSPAQIAAQHAHTVITEILRSGNQTANKIKVDVAKAHAAAAMQQWSKEHHWWEVIQKEEEKLLKQELTAEKKLENDVKHSTGKAKQAYEAALARIQKNIAATHAAIVKAGSELAKTTQEQAKKVAQKVAGLLSDLETAVDAKFEAMIAPLQAELDKMTAQQTAQNDKKAVEDATKQLHQDLLLGSVQQIIQDQAALIAAQNQKAQDQLQAKITDIQNNENKFNAAIEALIAKVNGTDPKSITSIMAQLGGTIGTGSDLFKNLNALLAKYLPTGGSGSGTSGGSGSGTSSGGSGSGSGGTACFTAETLVATPSGSVEIARLIEGDEVLVWDFATETTVPAPIETVFIHEQVETLIVDFGSGRRIYTTPEHPFWTGEEWQAAGLLRPGSKVMVSGPLFDEVLTSYAGPIRPVYNLHIDHPEHNYFAGGALVHNSKLPAMALGGIVTKPTVALIGEAGPEEVIPLSKMGSGGTVVMNVTVNGVIASDLKKAAHDLAPELRRELLRVSHRNTSIW